MIGMRLASPPVQTEARGSVTHGAFDLRLGASDTTRMKVNRHNYVERVAAHTYQMFEPFSLQERPPPSVWWVYADVQSSALMRSKDERATVRSCCALGVSMIPWSHL